MTALIIISVALNALLAGIFSLCLLKGPSYLTSILSRANSRRHYAFEASKVQDSDIVFFGDSLTQEGCWDEYFPEYLVVNRGISGNTVEDLQQRIDQVVALQPKKLLLLIGINNLNRRHPTQDIKNAHCSLLDRIAVALPSTQVLVQTILPVNDDKPFFLYAKNTDINELNEYLKEECKKRNLILLDTHALFADNKGSLKKEVSNDGLHLTAEAYGDWANLVASHL